ncbi:hypothetical protein MMC2321_03123 [Chitinophaga sp. MM2321]
MAQTAGQQPVLHIVPEPVSASVKDGYFSVNAGTRITAGAKEAMDIAGMLADMLNTPTGFKLSATQGNVGKSANAIVFTINSAKDKTLGDEGYTLKVSQNQVVIAANKPQGLFYGMQSLLQMLPPAIASDQVSKNMTWRIPCAEITDYPRFGWRGLMLDVSRHFFSKDFLKKYIDEMVKYKFNVFHIHLTDDQGWRIEIKGMPKLTELGAWRVPRQGSWWSFLPPQPGEPATYGGFYTQEDMKEIIRYAQDRNVTILPEIDIPGHSLAALTAYPELACVADDYHVNPGSRFYGQICNALCAGNEKTFEFLDVVYTEMAALFPGEYIHVGGDEAFKGFWEKCPKCQKRMKEEGLKNTEELQSYFIKRVEKILHAKGKKLIGWDEILEGGLAPDATVMSWRGMQGGINAAKMGHKVIMTPSKNTYLDLYQGDPTVEPETYSMLRLTNCYNFDPVPNGIDPKLILGGQGNLWTESVPTERHAEYMTWPRALALSEVFWSPKVKRNWLSFTNRMEWQFKYMDQSKVNYARSVYDVVITGVKGADDSLKIKLATEIPGYDIYYTFDGTNPDIYQKKYQGKPLDIPKGASQIRTNTFRNGWPVGKQVNSPVSFKLFEDRMEPR